MARESLITPEGLEKLKEELDVLQNDRRREVAERIKEAREFGDIAENSEYDDAKNEQAMLEQKIAQMEERIRRATVVEAKDIDTSAVGVGVKVHVKDEKTGDSKKFLIVGSAESNLSEGRLSHESPIGRALLGHKRNDVVEVEVPRGRSASSRSPRSRVRPATVPRGRRRVGAAGGVRLSRGSGGRAPSGSSTGGPSLVDGPR